MAIGHVYVYHHDRSEQAWTNDHTDLSTSHFISTLDRRRKPKAFPRLGIVVHKYADSTI